MKPPHPSCTKLQNFVATMLAHGNAPESLDLNQLAKFNTWTTADELLVEFRIQQNGTRKLPEEVAVSSPAIPETQGEGK
jgi:hypothetical protein